MDRDDYRQIEAMFQEAVDLAPEERDAFLRNQTDASKAVRHVVDRLLKSHESQQFASLQAVDASERDPLVSGRIGPYQVLELIGQGAFGAVYLAEQKEPLKRRVALKILKPGKDTSEIIARFERERQTLALMDHPNIAGVLDAGATPDGRPYFAMDFVCGAPITEHCNMRGLGVRDRLQLFLGACRAVQHAHQKGIIHRDLKPSNVLVELRDREPVVKVIDFGIATAARGGMASSLLERADDSRGAGTPGYMSPEQARSDGQDVDTRTDVYSLGAILCELLVGPFPYDVADPISRIASDGGEAQPLSIYIASLGARGDAIARLRNLTVATLQKSLSGDLDWIAPKAVEPDRSRRYASVTALADDVRRHLRDHPVHAGPRRFSYRVGKFIRRHKVGVLAGTVVAGIVVVAAVLLSIGYVWAERARVLAERNAAAAEVARQHEAEAHARAKQSRSEAIKEARRAQRVTKFLREMIVTAFPPARGGKHEVTVRSVLLEAKRKLDDGAFSEQPQDEATIRGTIAGGFTTLGEYALAEGEIRRALAVASRRFGPGVTGAVSARNLLSVNLHRQGRFEEAEQVAREAVSIGVEALGDRDPQVLVARGNLAAALTATGELQQAVKIYRKLLRRQLELFGEEDRFTLYSMHGLAVVLHRLGRDAESERFFRRVLKVRRRTAGDDDLETSTTMLSMAPVLVRRGMTDEALDLAREALAVKRRRMGATHPDTAIAMHNVALVLQAGGDIDEAIELLRDALSIQREALGLEHPDTQRTVRNMIRLFIGQDRVPDVIDLMESVDEEFRAASEVQRTGALDLPACVEFLVNNRRVGLRDPASALVLATRTQATDENRCETGMALASALRANGRLDQACATLERAIAAPPHEPRFCRARAAAKSHLLGWSSERGGIAGLIVAGARIAILETRRARAR